MYSKVNGKHRNWEDYQLDDSTEEQRSMARFLYCALTIQRDIVNITPDHPWYV